MISLTWLGMVRFYRAFNHNPEALRRLLSLYIASEARGEISPLTVLAKNLPDGTLREKVRSHLQDEGRHLRLLRKRLSELGMTPFEVPQELEIQEYYFKRDGRLAELFSLDAEACLEPRRLVEILLFASVLEEFVVSRMSAHAQAAAEGDPRTYFVLMDIVVDELRHSTYTQEQAYLIAGSSMREYALERHRTFREGMNHFGAYHFKRIFELMFPREVLGLSRLEYAGWRTIALAQERRGSKNVWPMPLPHPERLFSEPAPFGFAERTGA